MLKKSIRSEMMAQRQQLATGTGLAWSLRIQESFLRLPEFLAAGCVALYSPFRNEVFTEEIYRAARQMGKQVVYPRVRGDHLDFIEVARREELLPGSFGILEPAGEKVVPVEALDLMAVPGLAFDRKGQRLGYGRGYYDRVLHGPGVRCTLVGLCFEQQIVAALPAEEHDIRMDLLITEERIRRFDRRTEEVLQENYSYGGGTGH